MPLCLLIVVSCVPRTRMVKFERMLDSLETENARNKEGVEQLTHFVDVISEGLDSISHQESILYLPNSENNTGKLSRAQILDNIKAFERLIQRQRERIKELEDSLANKENTEKLLSVIAHLNASLAVKENEILSLKKELYRKSSDLSRMKNQVLSMESDIKALNEDILIYHEKDSVNQMIMQAQNEYLNQGMYLIATKKELKDYGVDRNGGLLSDVDESLFTPIDIRTFAQLVIPSTKVKMISPMPQSSFVLTPNNDGTTTLEIFDPCEFWKVSKFLIIQIR